MEVELPSYQADIYKYSLSDVMNTIKYQNWCHTISVTWCISGSGSYISVSSLAMVTKLPVLPVT